MRAVKKFFGSGASMGQSAAAFAPSPAPAGFHWEFVTSNGERVTAATAGSPAEPVVVLVGN